MPGATARPGRAPADPYLRATFRGAWAHLPVLLVGSVAVTAASAAAVVAGDASPVLGAAVAVVAVSPTLAALVACCCDVATGDDVGVRDYGAAVRRVAAGAIGAALVPAVLAALTVVALVARAAGGGAWTLLPAGVGTTATVLASVAWIVLLPLRASCPEPSGPRAWLLALHLFARRPVPFVAAAVVGALGVAVSTGVSNGLFLLVPAPFALVLAAAFHTSPVREVLAARQPSTPDDTRPSS
ncbi:hypothetical protein ACFQ8E_01315 [Isoptericola sp. NPDC056573]|uniref:hypothetical protein n=1 Tax=Isoptericola sp. NPDC056573 TaxID=3345868 RepID=UPI003684520B